MRSHAKEIRERERIDDQHPVDRHGDANERGGKKPTELWSSLRPGTGPRVGVSRGRDIGDRDFCPHGRSTRKLSTRRRANIGVSFTK